jgi:hypothetical protein
MTQKNNGKTKKQKNRTGETKHAKNDIREEQRPSRLTSSPLTRLYTESFGILQMLKLQKGNFPY